jgi:YggT family protein
MGRYIIATAIYLFSDIVITLICVQAVMSWFTPYFGSTLSRVYNVIAYLTEPFVRPFRGLCQRFTYSIGIDFSPLIAIIVIQVVARVLIAIIY